MTTQVNSPFGQSRIGGNITPTVKLKDGDNVFRVLPAMGDLAAEGRWSFYHAVHFGYKNSAGKLRPFNSTFKKNKQGMTVIPDAALERINKLTAMMEQAKAQGNAAQFEKLNALVGRGPNSKAQFNIDKKHYMNALDAQGNVVILAISHKAKLALEAEITSQRAKGLDPLAPEGCYLNFKRTGKGNDTLVQVSVARDAQDNKVTHTIDEALTKRLMKYNDKTAAWAYNEARNLSTLYPFPSPEEIQRIVDDGATAVDEILDGGNPVAAQAEPQVQPDDEETPAVETKAAPPPAVAPAAPVPPVAAVGVVAPAAPFAAAVKAPTTVESVAAQSDDDFLKSLGV